MSAELLTVQAAKIAEENSGRYDTLSEQKRVQQIAIDAIEVAMQQSERIEMSMDSLNDLH